MCTLSRCGFISNSLEMSSDDSVMFHGTFSKSSNLLNCIVSLKSSAKDASINVETGSIVIKTLTQKTEFNFHDLLLNPNTCRGLKYLSSHELQFSVQVSSAIEDLQPALQLPSSQSNTVDKIKLEQNKWFCATCQHKLLADRCIFFRVLPLPSENWQDYADMWFCHKHGEEEGDSKAGQRLLPGQRECFVGETYVLIDKQHLRNGAIKVATDGAVLCRRCGKQIGNIETDSDAVKIYLHTIGVGEMTEEEGDEYLHNNRGQQTEEFFSRLLLEQSQMYTSYRFIIEAKQPHESVSSTCLLWLLDSSGCVYRSGSCRTSCAMLQQECVVNVLFKCQLQTTKHSKPDPISKPLISLWKKDNTVHGIMLPHPVFIQLVNTLVQNCKTLPASQRFLNGFHVSFLQRSSISR